FAVTGQVVRNHLAGLQTAVVNRRAHPQRTKVGCLEQELVAQLTADDDRAHLERGELAFLLRGFADLEADVVAREQGAEPGDPAQRDTRLDNPELRVLDAEPRVALRG